MNSEYEFEAKIGDKIIVLDGEPYGDEYRSAWVPGMENLVGKEYEVIEINNCLSAYGIRDENSGFWLIDDDKCIVVGLKTLNTLDDITHLLWD